MKTFCGETVNGRAYYFQAEDCFKPIDDNRAVLLAKDNSPILKNVPVRRCDMRRGFVEHDSVFDSNNNFLGALVIVNDEFKICNLLTKAISDVPDDVVTYWHSFRPELFSYYTYPTIGIDAGDGADCTVPLNAVLFKKGGKVITTARKGYNILVIK